jgi:hypothetical protein
VRNSGCQIAGGKFAIFDVTALSITLKVKFDHPNLFLGEYKPYQAGPELE